MMGDDAYSCRAPGSDIERGVRVGLRILITRIVSAEVLPGSGPGGYLMFRYGDFCAGLKPSAGKTVNVPDLTARKQVGCPGEASESRLLLADVTDVTSIFNNGQHLFTRG